MINIKGEYGMRNRNNYFKLEFYIRRASETQSCEQDEKERLGRCSGIASAGKRTLQYRHLEILSSGVKPSAVSKWL